MAKSPSLLPNGLYFTRMRLVYVYSSKKVRGSQSYRLVHRYYDFEDDDFVECCFDPVITPDLFLAIKDEAIVRVALARLGSNLKKMEKMIESVQLMKKALNMRRS